LSALFGLVAVALVAAPGSTPGALLEARKLTEQLRYEEAVVEFQRYLGLPDRPLEERAGALLEVGFIHLVLGDSATAEARALEAFELDPKLTLPSSAPARQLDFVEKMRKAFRARARLEVAPRADGEPPYLVHVKVADPEGKVSRVLLRHALTSTGPYYSTQMQCTDGECTGTIPPPAGATSFTAWYFAEALDGKQVTLARVASPESPLQLAVVDQRSWLASPVTWGVAGGVVIAVATVVFFLAPPPPR
jgi:hypothetical protein